MNKKNFNKIVLFILCLGLSFTVSATTFTVNTTNDTNDANAGDGTCADADGNCSLRAAIQEANANSGADVINVPAGTYTVDLANDYTVNANGASKLWIKDDVTITGAGAASTIIQAASSRNTATGRVLIINSENSADQATFSTTIEHVTFRYGNVNKSGGAVQILGKSNYSTDGGHHNTDNSTVQFNNVIFTENDMTETVNGQKGGGLAMPGKAIKWVLVNNCTFENNASSSDGGGAYFAGKNGHLIFNECIVKNNTAADAGGGVFIDDNSTQTRAKFIINSSFENNTASGEGGGVAHDESRLIIVNSTFTGNSATNGGGYANITGGTTDTLHVLNSTFANNTASNADGGGGIFMGDQGTNAGGIQMVNCIVADNTANGVDNDLHVTVFHTTNDLLPSTNLVENRTESDGTNDYPNVFITTDPGLGTLSACSSNGVGVLPITSGSSAENAGDASFTGFMGHQDGILVSQYIHTIPYAHIVTDGTIQDFINFNDPTTDPCEVTRTGNPDLGAYEIGSALPVELVYFKGSLENEVVQLTWQTAAEFNNLGFEIERSINGVDFERIGFVDGHTTTNEIHDYAFIDETPALNNYYRLKQIDYDGTFEYSSIVNITIQQSNNSTIKIFPNPVQDELNIIDGEGQATIYNVLGQPVQSLLIPNSQFVINTQDLPKGQYILHILQQNGNVMTKQFVK